ncbi:MAG: alpha/beta hydrolase [Sideroxyarcus sp.]|nr:alpha/beta hydrolase [Sideroxyarcus sp.]
MKKWLIYSGATIVALILLVTAVGVVYETMGRSRAAREFPPQGKLVDIGGRRMQLDCRGSGSPTVVFEAGLDMNGSLSWSAVHDEVAKTTRACAYSRAGIMWSDPSDGPQNAKTIAEDLHAVLAKAGERPPYVLAGHSLGGPYIMTYTKYYGPEVAGLVFVDASHPDQVQRFNAVTTYSPSSMLPMIKAGVALAWAGAVRATPMASQGAPRQPPRAVQAMAAYAPTSLGAMLKEMESVDLTLAEAGTIRQLGNRPVFVLTSMLPLPDEALAALKLTAEQGRQYKEVWKALHDEEASWSSDSRHQLVADAGHYIQFERPDIVVEAVRAVVGSVRAQH